MGLNQMGMYRLSTQSLFSQSRLHAGLGEVSRSRLRSSRVSFSCYQGRSMFFSSARHAAPYPLNRSFRAGGAFSDCQALRNPIQARIRINPSPVRELGEKIRRRDAWMKTRSPCGHGRNSICWMILIGRRCGSRSTIALTTLCSLKRTGAVSTGVSCRVRNLRSHNGLCPLWLGRRGGRDPRHLN